MPDPELIDSPLSRVFEEDGESVEIFICRIADAEWTLEIVASDGCSTVWEEPFESEAAALLEAVIAIKDEGIKSFFEDVAEKGGLH